MRKKYIAPVSTVVKISLTLLDSTSPGKPKANINPDETVVEAEAIESRLSFSIWDDEEE